MPPAISKSRGAFMTAEQISARQELKIADAAWPPRPNTSRSYPPRIPTTDRIASITVADRFLRMTRNTRRVTGSNGPRIVDAPNIQS